MTSPVGVPIARGPRPCSPAEAIQRALSQVGKGMYWLGTGDWRPVAPGAADVPWTTNNGGTGSDCAGLAISYAYMLRRHRPGYNVGAWSTCSDDLNCNSAIEDAEHARDLFELADRPMPGDLLCYPTIRLPGHPDPFIGHVCIVVSVNQCAEWDPQFPAYHLLDVVQCCGPNGRKPGVIRSDGSIWDHHDRLWPKPEHRTRVLRAVP